MTLSAEIETKQAVADLGYQATVRIGGSDPDKFLPNINCSFARAKEDEFFLNVNAADVLVTDEKETLAEVSEIKVEDRTERYYVDEDGGLEYQTVFDSKPETNKISLQIKCSPELRFVHQRELTQAEIDYGFSRPENVVNSYAIKCPKKHNVYKEGKVGHIYRSWVEDVGGNREWCQQEIIVKDGAGTWDIVIPEDIWSDESLYPLTVGPRLGLETVQASSFGLSNAVPFAFYLGSMLEAGTLNFIRIRDEDTSTDAGFYVGVYGGSSSAPGSPIFESTEQTGTSGAQWHEVTGGDESLPNAEDIWVFVHVDAGNDMAIPYDDDPGNPSEQYMSGVTYGDFPDPWVNSGGNGDRDFNIYIDFDRVGGSTLLPIFSNHHLQQHWRA